MIRNELLYHLVMLAYGMRTVYGKESFPSKESDTKI